MRITEVNKSCKRCFEVDFSAHCDAGKSNSPMASMSSPVVWMFIFPDVTFDDPAKFTLGMPGLKREFARQSLRGITVCVGFVVSLEHSESLHYPLIMVRDIRVSIIPLENARLLSSSMCFG